MIKIDGYHYCESCTRFKVFGYFIVWKRIYFFNKWTPFMYLWLEK